MDTYDAPKTVADESRTIIVLTKTEKFCHYYILLFAVLAFGYSVSDFIASYLKIMPVVNNDFIIQSWIMKSAILPLVYLAILIGLIRKKWYGKYAFMVFSIPVNFTIIHKIFFSGTNELFHNSMNNFTNVTLAIIAILANFACLVMLLSPAGERTFSTPKAN